MASKLKLFVCEFMTGGGLYNAPLPPSLAREGDAMLGALLADLCRLPEVEVTTTRDARLPALPYPVSVEIATDDIWSQWARLMSEADAVWPIAPETDGLLERMSTIAAPARLVGCTPPAVHLTASKYATVRVLENAGIPVVSTWRQDEWQPGPGRFVAKPDDGVGCEDSHVSDDSHELRQWMASRTASHVIQPWLSGEPASLSMLCRDGRARLLSCNRQLIDVVDGEIRYRGSVLNDFAKHWPAFEKIAQQVAAAVPGLAGYAGVDLMLDGGALTVLEINPRLTTSYAGLAAATGLNPAGLVLDLLYNDRMVESSLVQRNVVEIRVDD